jgi:hypothetical protein
MNTKTKDIVFTICEQMLDNSPEASYKRLNPSLRSTLDNCITADLPFQRDTFQRIYNELRGGRWFGDGAGSADGEHFYTTACLCNHASAQQSFELFAERPGVLWEENAKQPERLHVGSEFTWKGHFITVTSMRKDNLVACSYKDYVPDVKGLKAGARFGYDPEWLVISSKGKGSTIDLRVKATKRESGRREVNKRFVIPYIEIIELRRTAAKRLKELIAKIDACDPSDTAALVTEINRSHFRHFELEDIRAAFSARKELFADRDKIQAWRDGRNGEWLSTDLTLLRLHNGRIECSNGNSISRAAATAVLPVLLEHRNKATSLAIPLESYKIERTNSDGVKIGCTIVPWSEIELIAPQLQTA